MVVAFFPIKAFQSIFIPAADLLRSAMGDVFIP